MLKIETKFNVGDKVIYMDNKNVAHSDEIEVISINVYMNKQTIMYGLKGRPYNLKFDYELYKDTKDLKEHICAEEPELLDFL